MLPSISAFSFSPQGKVSKLLCHLKHKNKGLVAICLSRAEQPALLAKFLFKRKLGGQMYVSAVTESKLLFQETVCLVSSFM